MSHADDITEEDSDKLRGNPAFERYILKVAGESQADDENQSCRGSIAKISKVIKQNPRSKTDRSGKKDIPTGNVIGTNVNLVKSPSDTTIYAPALKQLRGNGKQRIEAIVDDVNNISKSVKANSELDREFVDKLTENIINFIEGIWMQGGGDKEHTTPHNNDSRRSAEAEEQDGFNQQMEAAKRKATKLTVDAERFKATMIRPQVCMI